ncbi:MAG: phage terminase large subunit family protein [Bacteroidia bacterium]
MYAPAVRDATRQGLAAFKVAEPLSLSQWAEQNFYLSAESSYREGKWVAYPFQRELMDAISNDEVSEVVVQKSARLGYSKTLTAAIAYFAEHKRRNQCIWQPTDEDRDDFVKDEIEPMIRDVPCMERVFPKRLSRHKDNTLRQKRFLGSTLHMRGGNAAKNYRRISIDCGYLDEASAFERDIGRSKKDKEGDPASLARKRTEGATFPKFVIGSTPKIKGLDLTEERRLACEMQVEYFIRCIHCSEEHPLSWGGKEAPAGMKWTRGEPETVRHVCPHCGGEVRQAEYLANWTGRWVDSRTGNWIGPGATFFTRAGETMAAPRSVGFLVWTAYSPQASWSSIVRDFEEAFAEAEKGKPERLKTFTNTTLGLTWQETLERLEVETLKQRAGGYALRTVPDGVLGIAVGVDVQDDRFELMTWGFGRGEESWLIDYAVLHGDPGRKSSWDLLDGYRATRFDRVSGGTIGIDVMSVDTGGHFTHHAYNYCRMRKSQNVFAIAGDRKPGQPIHGKSNLMDVNWSGRILKGGVRLWFVGTDTAKDLLHARLRIAVPGTGYVHFPEGLTDEFWTGFASEARLLQKTASGEAYRWTKVELRNEPLDGTVYAIFGAHAMNWDTFTDSMWSQKAARMLNAAGQIAPPAGAPTVRPIPPPAPARRPAAPNPFASDAWSSRL